MNFFKLVFRDQRIADDVNSLTQDGALGFAGLITKLGTSAALVYGFVTKVRQIFNFFKFCLPALDGVVGNVEFIRSYCVLRIRLGLVRLQEGKINFYTRSLRRSELNLEINQNF